MNILHSSGHLVSYDCCIFLKQTCICYDQLSVLQLLWYFSRSKCTLTVLISVISAFVINVFVINGICFKALKRQRHFVCLSVISSTSPTGAYCATTDCEVRKILRVTYQKGLFGLKPAQIANLSNYFSSMSSVI